MNKSTLEEHLSQPLQTNNKQFKKAVTFLTGYNGISNVTNKNNKFCFEKSITHEDGYIQITIPTGAYEIESLKNEIKTIIIDEEPGPVITNVPNDTKGDLLGFNKTTTYEKYNLSPNPVDILSINNILFECNIAQGMIFKSKRSGISLNFTMDVDPGYKYIEKIRG